MYFPFMEVFRFDSEKTTKAKLNRKCQVKQTSTFQPSSPLTAGEHCVHRKGISMVGFHARGRA